MADSLAKGCWGQVAIYGGVMCITGLCLLYKKNLLAFWVVLFALAVIAVIALVIILRKSDKAYQNLSSEKYRIKYDLEKELKEVKEQNGKTVRGYERQLELQNKQIELLERKDKTNSSIIASQKEQIRSQAEKIEKQDDIIREKIGEQMRTEQLLFSRTPFKTTAEMLASVEAIIYNESETYLRTKRIPAPKAADEVKELKGEYKEARRQYQELLFKLKFLVANFPWLEKFIDFDEAILSLDPSSSASDIEEGIDPVIDYVSKDDWDKYTPAQRNQIALDKYCRKDKDKWEIGMLYEMFVDYYLRQLPEITEIIPFGIIKGLEDLGIDIIAKTKERTYLIQCKNWAQEKEIHENVVCQIFGTSRVYQYQHPEEKVVPVICSTVSLSETAQGFAEYLGVKVRVLPMGSFPMIKCNVNNGIKIYHLPFDQQYWKTKIDMNSRSDFYAWTVEEAEKKGFRRAYRYNQLGGSIM